MSSKKGSAKCKLFRQKHIKCLSDTSFYRSKIECLKTFVESSQKIQLSDDLDKLFLCISQTTSEMPEIELTIILLTRERNNELTSSETFNQLE